MSRNPIATMAGAHAVIGYMATIRATSAPVKERSPRGADFLAPMLFSGTADAHVAHDWTRHRLRQELRPNSTLIFDNAAFHKKKDLAAIAQENGHHALFLSPYSPDLNLIEHDFANLTKHR